MAVADFLKDLPTRNADNFTKIDPESCHRSSTGKKTAYVPVKDIPADQVIVTEKTNILLRYLHQQWDKKASTKKRSGEAGAGPEDGAKKPRLSNVTDKSNTSMTHSAAPQYLLPGFSTGHIPHNPSHPPPAYPGTSQAVNRFANQQ